MGCSDSDLEFRFTEHLRVERQLSDKTVFNYQRDLQRFRETLQLIEFTGWLELSERPLRYAVAELHSEGLSGRSLQRMLSALRSFYRYLNQQSICEHNPALAIKAPKAPRRLPQTLSSETLNDVLDTPQDDPLKIRDLAMMELLYSSGLRVSELVGINLSDIDLGSGSVIVQGKGRKMRQVPVGGAALQAIQLWLKERLALADYNEEALFVGKLGKRLSSRSVQKRLKELGEQSDVAGNLYPHRLRHSFATEMLAGSGDLRAVQELLGHADISTTQIYTHLDFKQLKSIYQNSHPRAKRREKN